MTCSEFQEILPDMLEQEAAGKHAAHLKSCSSCSELVADLRAISEGAKLLCAADEPSPRVWANIQRALESEGLIHDPLQTGGGVLAFPKRRWSPLLWVAPLTAILVLGAAFLLRVNHAPRETIAKAPIAPSAIPEQSNVAYSGGDVDEQQLLAEVSPSMRATYAENLKSVDAFIHDAQSTLDQNPDDDEARHFLMDAYQQKSMVYELAMDQSMQ